MGVTKAIVVMGIGAAGMATMGCNAGQAGRSDVGRAQVEQAQAARTQQTAVERGKYLVAVAACGDCHTPTTMGPAGPEPDVSRLLSGHPADLKMTDPPRLAAPWLYAGAVTNTAFAGPWGVSYAINLTPDEETGIGLWSEQVFVNALKTGRHMGVGRPIMPPMPWQHYSQMTDEDLKAIYAYLKSVEPRHNQAPEAVVAEPPAAAQPTGQ